MKRCVWFLVAVGCGAALTCSTQAASINFDNVAGGIPPVALPANFSPLAMFATEPGAQLLVFSGAGVVGTSAPNNLTAAFSPMGPNYDADVYVDFTPAVNDLTFNIAADNSSGVIAQVKVFYGGGLDVSLDVIGNGNISDPIPMDLTSYSDVSRVEIVNITDQFGLSYDDFFLADAVPEPTGALLFLAGTLAVGGWKTYRRR